MFTLFVWIARSHCRAPSISMHDSRRVLRHLGNEARDLFRLERIADVDDAHAGVEVREHDELLVERRVIGVGERVRAETAAAMTEVARLLGHLKRRYGQRRLFLRDVEDQQDVARLLAAERAGLAHDEQQVARARFAVVGVVGDLEVVDRFRGMHAPVARQVDPRDLGRAQIRWPSASRRRS